MRDLQYCGYCRGAMIPKWRRSQFSVCRDCGLIYRNPMPSKAELDAAYENAWKNPLGNLAQTGGTNEDFSREYVRAFLKCTGIGSASGASVLDYGAGRGAVLKSLQAEGVNAFGIEPYGLDTLRSQGLTAYKNLGELPHHVKFDAIFSNDVVEHLAEPWLILPLLRDRLKPGGAIVIATPNPLSLNARLKGKNWRETANPGHLCFMDSDVLSRLVREAGFSNVRKVRWDIKFSGNPIVNVAHGLLRRLNLDGVSRVMATSL